VSSVLLVDDAPELRELVSTILTDEGFDVTAFDAAEEALTHIDLVLPDLLILDGRLTRMSGWQCFQLLRASERTEKLPVLMLTAAVDDVQRAEQPADDCTAYVTKPFDIDELLAKIDELIETCAQAPA